jgi:hypothetical protein
VAAELELGVVEELDGAKSLLLELSRLRLVDGLAGQIGKRLAAPQIDRATEVLGPRPPPVPRREPRRPGRRAARTG